MLERLYYGSLTPRGKFYYRLIRGGLFSMSGKIPLPPDGGPGRAGDLNAAMLALRFDCPGLFWADLCSYRHAEGPNTFRLIPNYLFTPSGRSSVGRALEGRVERITKLAMREANPEKRELILHDALAGYVSYRDGAGYYPATAAAALLECEALCEGYSKAFALLCRRSGIPCAVVRGFAGGEGHAWNLVELGGEPRMVDVTWDGGQTGPLRRFMGLSSRRYFNLTPEKMSRDHTPRYPEESRDGF